MAAAKEAKAADKKKIAEFKARGKVASAIMNKISNATASMVGIMSRPNYHTLPPAQKIAMEDIFRILVEVEAKARACTEDNAKPLPESCDSVAEAVNLVKKAKKEEGHMAKLLMFMDKAAGAGA